MIRGLVAGIVRALTSGLTGDAASLAAYAQVAWGDGSLLTWGDGTPVQWGSE